MPCLVGTTPPAHHGGFRSHIPRQHRREEELANQEAFSLTGHLPSEPIMRAKNLCLLLAISFPSFITRLLTPRCASRGTSVPKASINVSPCPLSSSFRLSSRWPSRSWCKLIRSPSPCSSALPLSSWKTVAASGCLTN